MDESIQRPATWSHGTPGEPGNAPPHWEGLDAGQELGPRQEAG